MTLRHRGPLTPSAWTRTPVSGSDTRLPARRGDSAVHRRAQILRHVIAVPERIASHSRETPRLSMGTHFALSFSADDVIVVVLSQKEGP
jgi:hypothetical protein